ncbi:hypothetical protein BB8028_0004g10080 [Beauveria bassiana]|uniref:Uncharacterized protein n=1 Tax=Beauveria bassiana TaxID=176275 RepID=A0A2S7YD91_BEABA|nr:hypothetical protein BB8028_0004g10080 [Beauveria bassiana]
MSKLPRHADHQRYQPKKSSCVKRKKKEKRREQKRLSIQHLNMKPRPSFLTGVSLSSILDHQPSGDHKASRLRFLHHVRQSKHGACGGDMRRNKKKKRTTKSKETTMQILHGRKGKKKTNRWQER